MDVTIKLSVNDAFVLEAMLQVRVKSMRRRLETFTVNGEKVPEYICDDIKEKIRLLEIVSGAIEKASQEERERVDALIKQGRK